MIEQISGLSQTSVEVSNHAKPASSGGFDTMLRQELLKNAHSAQNEPVGGASVTSGIAFSKHAIMRAAERGIEVTPELVSQLSDSVERAQAKGATNILAFDTTRAFIINVPNSKVITTMSQDEMKENIFTNIDGAVLL